MNLLDTLFISDSHFGHKGILKWTSRGVDFPTVDHMDEYMIEAWNSVVDNDDVVIFGGDFSFHKDVLRTKEIANALKGTIHLVPGNHDHTPVRKLDRWESVDYLRRLPLRHRMQMQHVKKPTVVVIACHFPLEVWDGKQDGAIHVHGHCHGGLSSGDYRNRIDMGADCWDYVPRTIPYMLEHRKSFPLAPTVDHHGYRADAEERISLAREGFRA